MTVGVPHASNLTNSLPEQVTDPAFPRLLKRIIRNLYDQLDYARGTSSGRSEYLTSGTNGTLQVPYGGTGTTSGVSGGIPYYSATTLMASTALLTSNNLMLGGGAGAAPSTMAHPSTANQYALTGTTGTSAPSWTIATSSAATGTYALRDASGGLAMTSLTATTLTATFATFSGTVIMGSGLTVAGAATMAAVGMATLTATAATFSGTVHGQAATFTAVNVSSLTVSGAATMGAVSMATLTGTSATLTGTLRVGGGLTVAGASTLTSVNMTSLSATQACFSSVAEPATPAAGTVCNFATAAASGVVRMQMKSSTGAVLSYFRDAVTTIRNNSGVGFTKGQMVYTTGSNGTTPTVALALADSATTARQVGMVLSATIGNNSFGTIQIQGEIRGVDTSAFVEGDILWLSATVAGGLTNAEPASPNLAMRVGTVVTANANGIIHLFIQPAVINWGAPPAIGNGTPNSIACTTLTATAATFTGAINAQGATFTAINASTLAVSGATTLSAVGMATLTATAATFSGAIIAERLTVNGATTLSATGMATLTATAATFTGVVTGAAATFTGAMQLGSTLTVLGVSNFAAATFTGAINAQWASFTTVSAATFTGALVGNVTGNCSGSAGSVAASALTGTTLAAGVTASSLTSVGTLGSLAVTGAVTGGAGSTITVDGAGFVVQRAGAAVLLLNRTSATAQSWGMVSDTAFFGLYDYSAGSPGYRIRVDGSGNITLGNSDAVGTGALYTGAISATGVGLVSLAAAGYVQKFNTATGNYAFNAYQVNGSDKGYVQWNINDAGSGAGTAMIVNNTQGKLHLWDSSGGGLVLSGGSATFAGALTAGAISGTTGTFTGLVLTPLSATGGSGFRLPHGAAPTSPVDGDMWTTSAGGLFVRINGVTKTVTLT